MKLSNVKITSRIISYSAGRPNSNCS